MEQSKDKVIRELNQFLEGRYMGIHAYEHYIANSKDPSLKKTLQELQLATKRQAELIAERIQNLGGQAATDLGIAGKFQELMQTIKGYPDNPEGILHDALLGEHKYAIHKSHQIIEGDLDAESAKLVDTILKQDQKHVTRLKELLRHYTAVPQA